eukprot:SAG11_NODE_10671_length_812_cov_12.555400_1_plen_42_part_10
MGGSLGHHPASSLAVGLPLYFSTAPMQFVAPTWSPYRICNRW